MSKALESAFGSMESFGTIIDLADSLHFARNVLGGDIDLSEKALRIALEQVTSVSDPIQTVWHRQLNIWDRTENSPWATTPPQSPARRTEIYTRLGLEDATRRLLDDRVPLVTLHGPTVISDDSFEPWYTHERARSRRFYWTHYCRLLEDKRWSAESIADLDQATHRILERLADPCGPGPRQAKGLVVGYVQSGKTANFTGVVAKAIDAGYRLIIVLAGTLDLLRGQTQRRLDMELVGRENITRGFKADNLTTDSGVDYLDDPDWHDGKFVTYGHLPSELGSCDVLRLTTRHRDYEDSKQGRSQLEFTRLDPTQPLFSEGNLMTSEVRLIVTKKHPARLDKIISDLKKSGAKAQIADIPVLIIDDESDQASVNTTNPNRKRPAKVTPAKPGIRAKKTRASEDRTATNACISELLKLLPRAQYLGYTATPFANVFVDPSDGADIFPRDFILSLDRPPGYMGAQDFHDLDSDIPAEQRTVENSRERRHVRSIEDPKDDAMLQEALDAFVLSAAIKVYREQHGLGDKHFRHHTMLVHQSRSVADHRDLAQRLIHMWSAAGYEGPRGHTRLRDLFTKDVLPVSTAYNDDVPTPSDFKELIPHLGEARRRIASGGSPVIVVNSDKEIERGDADFDKRPIWKILVGGTKLSRGFTVEGLTITYYRRATSQGDTLMQMGRWFGFRKGYRDLVRLYIGRTEDFGRKGTVDLYEAFEALCRDEEAFRKELRRYSRMKDDGHPAVLPSEVPPLVGQHLPWLSPTARNKMYNAELVVQGNAWLEPTAYPVAKAATDLRHNVETWQPLLKQLGQQDPVSLRFVPETPGGSPTDYPAMVTTVTHGDLLAVLRQLRWFHDKTNRARQFNPYLNFLEELPEGQIQDWAVIAPQLKGHVNRATLLDSPLLSVYSRKRRPGREVFGALSDPKHRQAAQRIAGQGALPDDPQVKHLARPRRGAVLLYPVVDPDAFGAPEQVIGADGTLDPRKTVITFMIAPPAKSLKAGTSTLRFRVRDNGRRAEPIVEAKEA
ncbi:Z1 domain-containing protein [Streptomyces sp. NPDC002688]|uniref:Z1 domain-containing protein n=1 Tax=Streptomyces sp. NPDC002688 TaxID=3154423 RepID=UPI0033217A97